MYPFILPVRVSSPLSYPFLPPFPSLPLLPCLTSVSSSLPPLPPSLPPSLPPLSLSLLSSHPFLSPTMQVLFYRDCRTINKYEFATVTAEGVKIEGPIALDSNWEVAHYVRLDQLTTVV